MKFTPSNIKKFQLAIAGAMRSGKPVICGEYEFRYTNGNLMVFSNKPDDRAAQADRLYSGSAAGFIRWLREGV